MKKVYTDFIPTVDTSVPDANYTRRFAKSDGWIYTRDTDPTTIDKFQRTSIEYSRGIISSHQLEVSDSGKMIDMISPTDEFVLIPRNSVEPFELNIEIRINREGPGFVYIAADPAVRLNGILGGVIQIESRYCVKKIRQMFNDVWVLSGCCCPTNIIYRDCSNPNYIYSECS